MKAESQIEIYWVFEEGRKCFSNKEKISFFFFVHLFGAFINIYMKLRYLKFKKYQQNALLLDTKNVFVAFFLSSYQYWLAG